MFFQKNIIMFIIVGITEHQLVSLSSAQFVAITFIPRICLREELWSLSSRHIRSQSVQTFG